MYPFHPTLFSSWGWTSLVNLFRQDLFFGHLDNRHRIQCVSSWFLRQSDSPTLRFPFRWSHRYTPGFVLTLPKWSIIPYLLYPSVKNPLQTETFQRLFHLIDILNTPFFLPSIDNDAHITFLPFRISFKHIITLIKSYHSPLICTFDDLHLQSDMS